MNKKNFTMFELSLTAAVAVIFTAVTFTVISKVHADAIEVTCKSNQKQIMTAALTYANDYQGYMAPANFDSLDYNYYLEGYIKVPGGIRMGKKSYIKPKSKLLYCPDEPVVKNISYGVSSMFKKNQAAWNVKVENMNPSLIYLADINPNWRTITSTPSFIARRASINGNKWGEVILRHDDDTVNAAKIDGSVENLDEKTFKTDKKYWTVKK